MIEGGWVPLYFFRFEAAPKNVTGVLAKRCIQVRDTVSLYILSSILYCIRLTALLTGIADSHRGTWSKLISGDTAQVTYLYYFSLLRFVSAFAKIALPLSFTSKFMGIQNAYPSNLSRYFKMGIIWFIVVKVISSGISVCYRKNTSATSLNFWFIRSAFHEDKT